MNERNKKILRYSFILIMIGSLIFAAILFFILQKKLIDQKNFSSSKNNQNTNEKNEISSSKIDQDILNVIKTILKSPYLDLNDIDKKNEIGKYNFLQVLKNNYERLIRAYKNEKVKFSRLEENQNSDTIGTNHETNIRKLKFEAKLTKKFIELVIFLIEKDLLNIIKLKLNAILDITVRNVANLKDYNELLKHVETPLTELLHILGVLAFKYKIFIHKIFFENTFGKYVSLDIWLDSLDFFSAWSHEAYQMLLKLNKDQICNFITKTSLVRTMSKEFNFEDKIYSDFLSFLFKNNDLKSKNYLLEKNTLADIDLTKNYYKIITNEYCRNEINKPSNFCLEEKYFSKDVYTRKENAHPEEEFFFTTYLVNYFNNLKYKLFNSKVILYCYEKFNNGLELRKFLNVENMSDDERKNKIFEFLEQLTKFNDQKLLYIVLKNVYLYLFKCSEMNEYSQVEISNHIKVFINAIRKIENEEVEMFIFILKSIYEKKTKK
ncbi:hypothetical protein GVAV_000615 [Gurleya vavrai]